jgi:anthranilate/para-aminobenzoate synthase component I
MPDEQPQPVDQPGGGEGGGTTADGLYDLSGVAPEIRPVVESHLKAIEGRITPKLQEAAEYRKQWEPYEQLGLNQMEPQELEGLLSFAELTQAAAAGDPNALAQIGEWYGEFGEQLGLTGEDEDEYEDEDVEEGPDVEEAVAEAVGPLYQQMQQQQHQQLYEKTLSDIQTQTEALQKEHNLSEEDVDAVLRFAQSYDDEDDPISKGFEEFQSLIARGEKGLFQQKFGQTPSPEGGGPADNAPKPVTSFEQAKLMARERFAREAT